MKKIAYFLPIVLLAVLLSGCRANYRYLHETSQITEIQIVEITDFVTGDEGLTIPEFRTICTIGDTDALLDDLSDVKCYSYINDPSGVGIGSVGLKLLYDNGDYDLLSASGTARYYAGQRFHNYAGYYFDIEQFNGLIDKYTVLYGES